MAGSLVITRKVGERIVLNHGEVRIEIVDVKGKFVRLAFQANKEISIQREESACNPASTSDDSK